MKASHLFWLSRGMNVDIWIRDYNPPRCFQWKISGRGKHNGYLISFSYEKSAGRRNRQCFLLDKCCRHVSKSNDIVVMENVIELDTVEDVIDLLRAKIRK
jgi:hypothetical protein